MLTTALAVGDETGATQDERPHHDLGDVGLGGQHPPELGAAQPSHPAVDGHPAADQNLPVGEQSISPVN